jgi:hypothetical protein
MRLSVETKTKPEKNMSNDQVREQFEDAFDEARDAILHGRHHLEGVLDNDQTNAVLTVLDDAFAAALSRSTAEPQQAPMWEHRFMTTPNITDAEYRALGETERMAYWRHVPDDTTSPAEPQQALTEPKKFDQMKMSAAWLLAESAGIDGLPTLSVWADGYRTGFKDAR